MKEKIEQALAKQERICLYTHASHETEAELCAMEMRALFDGSVIYGSELLTVSPRVIDPDRSPFLSARIDILLSGASAAEIAAQAGGLEPFIGGRTYKVTYIKSGDPYPYDEQRAWERLVGSRVRGRADMKNPDVTLGLIAVQGLWLLGICQFPARAWHAHIHKPQNYSTGLSAALARTLVNIMSPVIAKHMQAVDPCCGMGNVLIEALSMGLEISGRDMNPLAIRGARTNLEHYGYATDRVTLGDMNELEGRFDAAVLDMPYNLCSVLPVEEQNRMLASLRRLAPRAVIVSTEDEVRDRIEENGFRIVDECRVWKGNFVRHVWLCEAR